MKIATVIGARPQFIKMALVSKALKKEGVAEVIIHTGQHYDSGMSGIFFKELKIPKPKYNLGVGSLPRKMQIAKMAGRIRPILAGERPELVLVYGDTNSTLAGAIAASQAGIPIAHVEAGLRSFNRRMPEELNRVATDRLTSVFFCPTKTAVANLKREGHRRGICLVGDVMYDLLKGIRVSGYQGIRGRYALCTIHRAENTDLPKRLKNIFRALGLIDKKIILPLHPRTEKRMKEYGIRPPENVKIKKPVGYKTMLGLQKGADIIITDSGGVQKEALILGIPCVTLRNETEWVETVKSGMNFMAGADPGKITTAVKKMPKAGKIPDPGKFYGDGNAHKRIAAIIKKRIVG